jgi:hypothetical protein
MVDILGAGGQKTRHSISDSEKFSLSTVLRLTLHHTRPRILWLDVSICSGIKRTLREADRSLVTSGAVKNE